MAMQNIVVFALVGLLSIYSVTAQSPTPSPTKSPVAAPKSAPPPLAMTPPAPAPEKSSPTTPPAAEPSPAAIVSPTTGEPTPGTVNSPPSMISATPAEAPGPSTTSGEDLKKVWVSGAVVGGLLAAALVI